MQTLQNKVIVITGSSRGIGLAIALRCAAAGATIALIAKETDDNTLDGAAKKIIDAGGKALPLNVDLCDVDQIHQAVDQIMQTHSGIDALINNTSAFCFLGTEKISAEQFDKLMATNMRATYFMSQACIPHLRRSKNPHIITISPPLDMQGHWFKHHPAFTMSKYGMSMCTLSMSAEFEQENIAINSLWPETTIATTTIKDHFLPEVYAGSRWPSIMADAAFELLSRSSNETTGKFYTDTQLLQEAGVTDFSTYAVDPNAPLIQDLFVAPAREDMVNLSAHLYRIHAKQ